ncbi:MAG TPA: flagellar biosynthesis protein FlhF [Pirellulales bacterium]|nr:flagellar biosynthesis protein FlhF [Pirellulales bacterium]
MDVKTYRARTMQEALALVRRELGPEAAVLQTREVRGAGWRGLFGGARQIEVVASKEVNVPSRLPKRAAQNPLPLGEGRVRANPLPLGAAASANPLPLGEGANTSTIESSPGIEWEAKAMFRDELKGQLDELHSLVEELCRRSRPHAGADWSDGLFRLYADLIEAEISEDIARDLIERLRSDARYAAGRRVYENDLAAAQARLAEMVEDEIPIGGPIRLAPGKRRLVALVGPTGVGKTTTIAKLAANFRLRDKRRVGLITVDTYRIAAVEQLRTYADIIDLPMRVVATPHEMREAVDAMSDLDLVLLDTAGRSPQDEVKLRELKLFLSEAEADEVHLVLSSTASTATLLRTAERFAALGTTALVLTKLDEAGALGSLLPLWRSCKLPLSYLTNGQNVPDDIAPADRRLARSVLGM